MFKTLLLLGCDSRTSSQGVQCDSLAQEKVPCSTGDNCNLDLGIVFRRLDVVAFLEMPLDPAEKVSDGIVASAVSLRIRAI